MTEVFVSNDATYDLFWKNYLKKEDESCSRAQQKYFQASQGQRFFRYYLDMHRLLETTGVKERLVDGSKAAEPVLWEGER